MARHVAGRENRDPEFARQQVAERENHDPEFARQQVAGRETGSDRNDRTHEALDPTIVGRESATTVDADIGTGETTGSLAEPPAAEMNLPAPDVHDATPLVDVPGAVDVAAARGPSTWPPPGGCRRGCRGRRLV